MEVLLQQRLFRFFDVLEKGTVNGFLGFESLFSDFLLLYETKELDEL